MAAPDIGSRPCCRSLFCALDLGAADSGVAAGSDFATVGDGGAALGVAGFFDLSAVGAAGSKRKGFDRHNDQLALPSATNVGSLVIDRVRVNGRQRAMNSSKKGVLMTIHQNTVSLLAFRLRPNLDGFWIYSTK